MILVFLAVMLTCSSIVAAAFGPVAWLLCIVGMISAVCYGAV